MIGGGSNLVEVHGHYSWDNPEEFAKETFAAMKSHLGYLDPDDVKRLARLAVRRLGYTDWVEAQRGKIGGIVCQTGSGCNWRLSIVGPMTRNQHKRLPNPPVYLRQPTFEERGIAMFRAMKRWV